MRNFGEVHKFLCKFYAKQKSSAAALPFAGENPGYQIIALLLAEGAFLRPGEILFGKLENDRRKQRHCNEVGDGHHAVEGFGDAPEEIELDSGTNNGNQGIDDHEGLDDLFTEEVLAAAGTVQAPAQDGGEGEAAHGHGGENGDPVAVGAGKAADGQLRAGSRAEGDGHAAAQDDQRGEGADDDGIHKYLKDTEQTLLHRIIDLGACMGNRGSTKTGFIGEDAAGNTLLYGGEHGAYYAAGHSGGVEGALNDGGERRREIPDVNNDNAKTQHHIQKRHNGNQTLRHMTDALDAAQQNEADQDGDDDA